MVSYSLLGNDFDKFLTPKQYFENFCPKLINLPISTFVYGRKINQTIEIVFCIICEKDRVNNNFETRHMKSEDYFFNPNEKLMENF